MNMSEDTKGVIRSSKVVVRESSQANSSSRIYYYGGASVPFLWETRPGTPKHSESFRLPPLTPPPSYYSSSSENKQRTKQTRFVKAFFNGKRHLSRSSFSWSSSTTSSSSSSSSSSFSSSPLSKTDHRVKKCYLSCSRSYVMEEEDDGEEIGSSSPRSTLCYKRGFGSSLGSVKRALCYVLSHGSSRKDLRLI